MTESPADARGDQPRDGTGLTGTALAAEDLAARLRDDGELTPEEVAALARFDDGAGGPCDDDPGPDIDATPPLGRLALPGDDADLLDDADLPHDADPLDHPDLPHDADPLDHPDLPHDTDLLDDTDALECGGSVPRVAEALEAGFTHRYASPGATGFTAGGPLDVMLPGPDLAWHAGQARRRGVSALSDSELCGLISAARRLASWAAELELTAITGLDARRAGPAGRPGEHVTEEIAALLTLTPRAGDNRLALARNLDRLPKTRALLAAGIIDQPRADVIASALAVLDSTGAAVAENQIAPRAWEMTTGQLRAVCERAIKAYDPGAAKQRRERAQQDARVECWAEAAGTSALAGRDLSPAGVIAADKTLDADARWLHRHGMAGSHDQRRAAAYLARLTNRPLHTLLDQPGAAPTQAAGATPAPGPGTPATPTTGAPGGTTNPTTPTTGALGGTVNLTMPASAWLGLTDNPGEAGGPGALDADTCRELAKALAANPATRWCLTLINPNGRAIAHGCARAGPGPPGSGDPATWLATVKITPIETGTCSHRRESAGYQPSNILRHVIKIRSPRCGFPGCRRPAVRCDDDHTIPYDKGGRTCECNLHPLCRRHHQAKQAPGWRLDQPEPGVLIWTLPSGRTYTVRPEPYPV